MRGRVVSLVVALVVAAAPLARALCDVSCAEGAHHTDSTVHAHDAPTASMHAHHVAMPESNTKIENARCCDAGRPVASVAVTKTGIELPAIGLASFTVLDDRAIDVSMIAIRSIAPPASPPPLHTPLRV
jgi:hypothetical protein